MSYIMVLGDWDTDGWDNYTFICFVFATMIQMIIMLNVLIAIVSSSF